MVAMRKKPHTVCFVASELRVQIVDYPRMTLSGDFLQRRNFRQLYRIVEQRTILVAAVKEG